MGKVARDETLQRVANSLEAIALNGPGGADVSNWKTVQNLVRSGMGQKAFPVGTQFVVKKETSMSAAMGVHTGITAVTVTEETFLAAEKNVGTGVHEFHFNGSAWIYNDEAVDLTTYGIAVTGTPAEGDEVIITEAYDEIVWDVVHHKTVDGKPRMVLLMHYVINNRPVDAREAFYYASEALPAGNYSFTVKNDPWKSQDDTVIYFTLANELPQGGQIRLNFNPWDYAMDGKTASCFASGSSTTATETFTFTTTALDSPTDLGDTDGSGNLNFFHRSGGGSNNYKESAIRQWLNSSAAGNNWWASTNKFDAIPGYANQAGFLHGMDKDFVDLLQECTIPCKTNNTFELSGWTLNTAYTVKDRIYLPSRDELGYGSENVAEGSVWDFYNGASNTDRIKYDIAAKSTARVWWHRSPTPTSALGVRLSGTSGAVSSNLALNGNAAAAACEIG